MWCLCGFIMFLLICGASRWLVYSRLRLSLPSCQSSQPVWESHLPLAVPRLWTLLHPEEPPLCPLHQSVRPSDQLAQWVSSSTFYLHASGNYTTSSPAINKKLKQMWLSAECFAFLWLLCEWSHRAVNGRASDEECMDRIFTPFTVILVLDRQALNHIQKTSLVIIIWFLTSIFEPRVTCVPAKPQCLCLCCSRLLR